MNSERLIKRFIPMSETMFYILYALKEERHGYGIMQYVEGLTNGRIRLGAGTVYQTLSKLESEKLIIPVREIDRKKEYVITDTGKELFLLESARICELYRVAKEALQ